MTRVLFHRIVCAVGNSSSSANALDAALQLARVHDARVTVLHVAQTPYATAGSVQRSRPDVFRHLRTQLSGAGRSAPAISWTSMYGHPPAQIVREIARTGADLAVVGRDSISSRTTVDIVDHIVQTTICPVLVAPPPDVDREPALRNIVCSVSSGLSTRTLQYALSLAQEFEGRLTILTVDEAAASVDAPVATDLMHLRALMPSTAAAWCDIEELTVGDDPVRGLNEAAGRLNPDLIVIGATRDADAGFTAIMHAALRARRAYVLIVPAAHLLAGVTDHRASRLEAVSA